MKSRRLRQLDSLRGIAAFFVLLTHNLASASLLDGRFGAALRASPLRSIAAGRPPVLFFFVLSGFVLTRALRATRASLTVTEYARWILQRTVRLGLPATGALAISALFYAIAYRGVWPGEANWVAVLVWTRPLTAGSFAAQATLLAVNNGYYLDVVLWTLVHEWRISMLLPFIAAAAIFRGRSGAGLLVLVGIALGSMNAGPWGESLALGNTFAATWRSTLYFLLPFLLGAALEAGDVAEMGASRWHILAAVFAVLGLGRVGSDFSIFLASALLIWLALQPGLIQQILLHPALVWLGTISFSLYLIHVPVLGLVFNLLHSRLPSSAICALSIAAALPAAYLFYLVVERPAHRLARMTGYRRLPSAPPVLNDELSSSLTLQPEFAPEP